MPHSLYIFNSILIQVIMLMLFIVRNALNFMAEEAKDVK